MKIVDEAAKSRISNRIGNLVLSIAERGVSKSWMAIIHEVKIPEELKVKNKE